MTRYYAYTGSLVGTLLVTGDDEGVCSLDFVKQPHARQVEEGWVSSEKKLAPVLSQLAEYFAGSRRVFDLPLQLTGTAFQQKVWKALCEIPFGEAISYGELARRIGQKGASRAVGNANGRNPIPVIIPCHRVIAADGALGGFSSGLPIKRALLRHEGISFR